MCGFAGVVGSSARDLRGIPLEQALDRLVHRGPDDHGLESGEWWALGFRRLSIIDLSPTGHQPMVSRSSRSWIVLNGEIYNYRSLREELRSAGWTFRGTSDTEVLQALYEHCDGDMESVLSRVNGMFAFAIVDRQRGRLLLARDRLGVKPLHYAPLADGLVFGSEIKALLPLLPERPAVCREAILAYLRLGFVPSWLSAHRGLHKLRPGHWAEWSRDTGVFATKRYWRPATRTVPELRSERQCIVAAGDLLRDATRTRLFADVPLGLFLSGGIDSGLVASDIAALGRADVVAHTIHIPGWQHDESELARRTAGHLGLSHRVHTAAAPTTDEMLEVVGHFDEPFADSSALVTSKVSKQAREHATVILTGDGGDESFAGYKEYPRAKWIGRLGYCPDIFCRALGGLVARLPGERSDRMAHRLSLSRSVRSAWTHLYPGDTTLEQTLCDDWSQTQTFDPECLSERLGLDLVRDGIDRAQVADLQLYMVDDVLTKVDMMSMLHSLEIRSPLLDYRLVELALSIPPRIRMSGGRTKAVLRALAERTLPPEVVEAPKTGFGVPLDRYLWEAGEINSMVRDVVGPLEGDGWFRRGDLQAFLAAARPPRDAESIYKLLCLGIWKESDRCGSLA